MANKFRGEAELTYDREVEDGETRKTTKKLVFDANAFCEIEDAIGINLGGMIDQMANPREMSMRTVRGILYGGLQKNHPAKSVEEGLAIAGDVISDAGLQETMEVIQKAMAGAMPKAAKGSAGKAPRKATPATAD